MRTSGLREWIGLATCRRVVRRAAGTAVIVGALLIAINQGSAIVHQELSASRWLRMILTIVVPYLVSTFSTVAAIRESVRRVP